MAEHFSVGVEGFPWVEYSLQADQRQPQSQRRYWRTQTPLMKEAVMDSNQAAELCGGLVIRDHGRGNRKAVIDCNQAAQLYGGLVLKDRSKKSEKEAVMDSNRAAQLYGGLVLKD